MAWKSARYWFRLEMGGMVLMRGTGRWMEMEIRVDSCRHLVFRPGALMLFLEWKVGCGRWVFSSEGLEICSRQHNNVENLLRNAIKKRISTILVTPIFEKSNFTYTWYRFLGTKSDSSSLEWTQEPKSQLKNELTTRQDTILDLYRQPPVCAILSALKWRKRDWGQEST